MSGYSHESDSFDLRINESPMTDDNIEYDWQSTPGLWMATRPDYCGCEKHAGFAGFGRTKEEAAADLIDLEEGLGIS